MRKLTLATAKSTIAKVLGVCTTDSRVATYINEAVERLMYKGKWAGTMIRYRTCQNGEGCLVWPRQVETIEAFSVCDDPGVVRPVWYEFLGNGPGMIDSDDNWGIQLLDRGTSPTFDIITGTTKKIKVYADVAESASARILIQGYDDNGNWIRTQDSGEWVDGEYVTISTTAQYTTKLFTSITGVIKPTTNGVVRLYEYEPSDGTQKALAFYEPDETHPVYRVSLIPGLDNMPSCDGATCDGRSVTVLAKLRFIPVANDNDWIVLGNLAAIKLMVMAIRKEEQNLWDEAAVYEAKAVQILQDELRSYQGDGTIPAVRWQDSATWGAGGVENVI